MTEKVVDISGNMYDTALLLRHDDGALTFMDRFSVVTFDTVNLNALARWVLDELDIFYDENDFPVDVDS